MSGDPDFVIGEGDPVQRVASLLQEKPALVILDNFESVLGREPLMPAEELKAVLDAVWLWADGTANKISSHGSRLLITTRDTSFNDSRFSPSQARRHVALQGLAPHDALELAAVIKVILSSLSLPIGFGGRWTRQRGRVCKIGSYALS
jgi:hypothetical protein